MNFILEEIKTNISADREELNDGFFGGISAIDKPTIFVLTFISLDRGVKMEVSLPEDHIFADEMVKLSKGRGQMFNFQML